MDKQVQAARDGDKAHVENRVQPVPFGRVNIYFIETEWGHILIDAGMPDKDKELDQVFKDTGVDPKTIHLIIATHAHLDHIGSIAYARRVSGAMILCHRVAAEYVEKGVAEPATPRNFMGRLLNFLTSLSGSRFEGIAPDIIIEAEFDLGEFGVKGKILPTPGHSGSSISIILENGECLIGDMVRDEGAGRIGLGMFYDDKNQLLDSLARVAAYEPRVIYLSHGDTIDHPTLKAAISSNR